MEFRIAVTPALEKFGGPSEDSSEGSFIDLNFPGICAKRPDYTIENSLRQLIDARDEEIIATVRQRTGELR